jgi:hypothetical protein
VVECLSTYRPIYELVPVRVVRAHKGKSGLAPRTLNFGIGYRRVPLLTRRKTKNQFQYFRTQ